MSKAKVAVIGSGPAGLCALKHMLSEYGDTFDPVAFERCERIGGQWVYTEDTSQVPLQSAVYKNMRCNIPKEVICYPDFSFPDNVSGYVHHSVFLKYLEDYTEHFGLRPYIRLNTEVIKIIPIPVLTSSIIDQTIWEVTTKNVRTGVIGTMQFDAMFVCNGHYSAPHVNVTGLDNFKGTVFHSQVYRNPAPFHSQSILVVGSSLSGIDIAIEIASVAKTVYLSQTRKAYTVKGPVGKNIVPVTRTLRIEEDGLVLLQDGRKLSVDGIVLCTGYEYEFPFLSNECGITVENNRVQHLYKHMFNTHYPSMAFIGIHVKVLALFNMDIQVKAALSVFTGKHKLPDKHDMLEDEEEDYKERILKFGLLPSDTHDFDHTQWSYYASLAEMIGCKNYDRIYEEIYNSVGDMRKNDVTSYKNFKCVILDWDKGTFTFKK